MNKIIRDGKIAILYSPGFGAGWSTWIEDKDREKALFHPELIKLVEENKHSEITQEFLISLGFDKSTYLGGVLELEIKWLNKGEMFYVDEYDGNESIVTNKDLFLIA